MVAIRRIFGAPFAWGASDCCTAPSDAFRTMHGIDPMGPLRGTYRSHAGALRTVRRFGGFRAMAIACAASAGLRGGSAAPGCIAVVTLPEAVDLHFDAALAFGMPAGWWVRLENAVITLPFDAALECWRA